MMMAIAILLTLNLGIALGWYAERLLRAVNTRVDTKVVQTGIVKTEVAHGRQSQAGSVVKSRTPKEVAADQDKKFNDEHNI